MSDVLTIENLEVAVAELKASRTLPYSEMIYVEAFNLSGIAEWHAIKKLLWDRERGN